MNLYVSSLEGNRQFLDGGSMFGNAPRALWEKWIPPNLESKIPLACRALLVEYDSKTILCETGIGSFFSPKLAKRFGVQDYGVHVLLKSLKEKQKDKADIDYVILSHLHFDHAGGLLGTYEEIEKGKDELQFRKAKFLVGEKAFLRASNPHPRDRASFIPGLVEKLKESNRLLLIRSRDDIPDSLKPVLQFVFTDGHTPGQMHAFFKGKKGSILYAGDLIPGQAWVHLPITMGYDRFPEKLIDEKNELYKEIDLYNPLNQKGTYIFYTHDPYVSCSKVEKRQENLFTPVDVRKTLNRLKL